MKKSIKSQGFRKLGKNSQNPNRHGFKGKNATNACTSSPQHDPSSQPSQLECKMQEILKISKKEPKIVKTLKNWEKSPYLGLILETKLKPFETLRDLAENLFESVWVERKREKNQMNRV
jgi:hypothetical protein